MRANSFLSFCCVLNLLLVADLGYGQTPTVDAAFRDLQSTYNFDPSKLSFDVLGQLGSGLYS
jgi:hypothetical protein